MHAPRRDEVAGSHLAGLLVGRYLLELEPLTAASVEELADRVGPELDHYLEPVRTNPDA